eukprot:7391532-Prymnesium_polylepis.1
MQGVTHALLGQGRHGAAYTSVAQRGGCRDAGGQVPTATQGGVLRASVFPLGRKRTRTQGATRARACGAACGKRHLVGAVVIRLARQEELDGAIRLV